MKSVHVPVFATLAALAMAIAAGPAQAQDYASSRRSYTAPRAYNAQGNPHYGFGPRVTVHPHDVVTGGRVIGRDPDPFVRGEILRHYDSGWPDP